MVADRPGAMSDTVALATTYIRTGSEGVLGNCSRWLATLAIVN